MSAAWLVVGIIIGFWGFAVSMVMLADLGVKRKHRTELEMREWREKVDAMRRLHDQEGDA
jgi:uncharacterized membrane-anchored protein YhcB (DUF1043 family)